MHESDREIENLKIIPRKRIIRVSIKIHAAAE